MRVAESDQGEELDYFAEAPGFPRMLVADAGQTLAEDLSLTTRIATGGCRLAAACPECGVLSKRSPRYQPCQVAPRVRKNPQPARFRLPKRHHFMMSRCRAFIASAKPLVSAPSPSGACTVPVPRSWRSLLHVPVALPLPLARAPPRRNREGRGSSDHRRSSPAAALIQRRWRNLALKTSLQ
jgi:hypothetical protein